MTREEAEEYIDTFRTGRGGFSKESFNQMGVPYPPIKGWRRNLVQSLVNGVKITDTHTLRQRLSDLEDEVIMLKQKLESLL